jgi:proteasome lid subunit RPN8/RPN11
MEMRVESSFRPGEPDVEVLYALSGADPSMPDRIHKLASSEAVQEATPQYVRPGHIAAIVEQIRRERGSDPEMVIFVHSHPNSVAIPSEGDKDFFLEAAKQARELQPQACILFGVHAVSSEERRRSDGPAKTAPNRVRWSSILREHEVGFYDDSAGPVEVELDGRG